MIVEIAIATGISALMIYVNRKCECGDCGEQLHWIDPSIYHPDLPMTRCFNCEGEHPDYY